MKMTTEQLLKQGYNIKNGKATKTPKAPRPTKIPKPDKAKQVFGELTLMLKKMNIPYSHELQFHHARKWRFDLAAPSLKLAWEYEGIYSTHSRHTNNKGYSQDTTKYNQAQILGWKVLRYTATTKTQIIPDFNQIIQNENT
jgi:hypothetical protein